MKSDTAPYAMSVRDAAKHAGVGRNTIYNLMSTGELPSSKLLSRRIILREDLEKMILAKRAGV